MTDTQWAYEALARVAARAETTLSVLHFTAHGNSRVRPLTARTLIAAGRRAVDAVMRRALDVMVDIAPDPRPWDGPLLDQYEQECKTALVETRSRSADLVTNAGMRPAETTQFVNDFIHLVAAFGLLVSLARPPPNVRDTRTLSPGSSAEFPG